MSKPSRFVAALLYSALVIGCDHPFQTFQENDDAIFSIFGYLDLRSDTQWVRVMPVRQSLFLAPEPIDALVTLEHLRTGRTVTLRDSLFRFEDRELAGVAYAYNFWTTEPLEPGASYRLTATRSDGASTTALVDLPPDLEFSLHNDVRAGPDAAMLEVRAERLLWVDVFYQVETIAREPGTRGDPAGSIRVRQTSWFAGTEPGTTRIFVEGGELERDDVVDVRRQEIRIVAARADWPYHAGLSDLEVALPGTMPSNVENGLGYVGGVVTWTIPFDRCAVLAARPAPAQACASLFNGQSASLVGRVIRQPCGTPHTLEDVRLVEEFAGGGAAIRTWKTDWSGEYRFEGIEPGSRLTLDLGPGTPAVRLRALGTGERYTVPETAIPIGC